MIQCATPGGKLLACLPPVSFLFDDAASKRVKMVDKCLVLADSARGRFQQDLKAIILKIALTTVMPGLQERFMGGGVLRFLLGKFQRLGVASPQVTVVPPIQVLTQAGISSPVFHRVKFYLLDRCRSSLPVYGSMPLDLADPA